MKLKKTIAAIAAAALTVSAISFAAFADPDDTTAHEHNYTSAITTPATCTTKGVKTFTCQNEEGTCDAKTYTEEIAIDPTAHTEVTIPAVEATCTKEGSTEGKKCSACDTVLEPPTTVAKKAHTETAIAAKDPTCTAAGNTAGSKCSVCNTILTATTVVPATGHTWVDDEDNEGAQKCSVCGVAKPAEHTHEYGDYTVITEATCTETGVKTATCTVENCGDVKTEEIPATGHDYVDGICANCGDEQVVETPEPEAPAEDDNNDVTPPAEGDDENLPSDDDNVTPPADDDDNNDTVTADGSASVGVVTGASSSSEAVTVSTPAQVAATRNPNLTVNAGEASVSSDMLTAFVKNDDAKTLTLSYSSTLKIAVDKDDVSDTSADLDISVSTEGFLSAKEIKKLDATKVVQIDLEGEGSFDGVDKVTVKYRVGAKLAGKEVTVYEYVNGKLVKIGTGNVTANGFVNFKTDHFGQFVIAVE